MSTEYDLYTECLPPDIAVLAENIAAKILLDYGFEFDIDKVLKYALIDMARKFNVDLSELRGR